MGTEYDFDGNPIGCKVEQKWNEFVSKTEDKQRTPSPKQRAVPLAPSHSMRHNDMHGMMGKFLLLQSQMQQYVIDDLVKKDQQTSKKLDDIMKRLAIDAEEEKAETFMIDRISEEKQEQKQEDSYELKLFKLWLKNDVQLEQYLDVLLRNGFDSLRAMETTNVNQLMEIGISRIGHAQLIMKHVEDIKVDDADKMRS